MRDGVFEARGFGGGGVEVDGVGVSGELAKAWI